MVAFYYPPVGYILLQVMTGNMSNWIRKGKDGAIPATDGFIFKGPGEAQNYTFAGSPNDGELTTNIGAMNWYLLGNPFSSALNARKFIQDNLSSIEGTLYFWDHVGEKDTNKGHYQSGYIGGYATVRPSLEHTSLSRSIRIPL